jgi:hypothetical protein
VLHLYTPLRYSCVSSRVETKKKKHSNIFHVGSNIIVLINSLIADFCVDAAADSAAISQHHHHPQVNSRTDWIGVT